MKNLKLQERYFENSGQDSKEKYNTMNSILNYRVEFVHDNNFAPLDELKRLDNLISQIKLNKDEFSVN